VAAHVGKLLKEVLSSESDRPDLKQRLLRAGAVEAVTHALARQSSSQHLSTANVKALVYLGPALQGLVITASDPGPAYAAGAVPALCSALARLAPTNSSSDNPPPAAVVNTAAFVLLDAAGTLTEFGVTAQVAPSLADLRLLVQAAAAEYGYRGGGPAGNRSVREKACWLIRNVAAAPTQRAVDVILEPPSRPLPSAAGTSTTSGPGYALRALIDASRRFNSEPDVVAMACDGLRAAANAAVPEQWQCPGCGRRVSTLNSPAVCHACKKPNPRATAAQVAAALVSAGPCT
jgi:hypothetical protein